METCTYRYKWCFVPSCRSTTIATPDKLFVNVPKDAKRRKLWFDAAKRERKAKPLSLSTLYCCEDHFNLQEDMENYLRYRMMGGHLKSKKNAVPHRFLGQLGRDVGSNVGPQKKSSQREAERIVAEALANYKPNEILLDVKPSVVDSITYEDGQELTYSIVSSSSAQYRNDTVEPLADPFMDDEHNLDITAFKLEPITTLDTLPEPTTLPVGHQTAPPVVNTPSEISFFLQEQKTSMKLNSRLPHDEPALPFESFDFVVREEHNDANDPVAPNLLVRASMHYKTAALHCTSCLQKFRSKSLLVSHLQQDNPERPCKLMCTFCYKSYDCNSTLLPQLTGRTDVPIYSCSKCGLYFRNISVPIRKVKGKTEFVCSLCRMVFDTRYKFRRHERFHTTVKSFRCTKCDERFNSVSGLKRHEDFHTAERPFACSECNLDFRYKHHLRHHMKVHDNRVLIRSTPNGRSLLKRRVEKRNNIDTGVPPINVKVVQSPSTESPITHIATQLPIETIIEVIKQEPADADVEQKDDITCNPIPSSNEKSTSLFQCTFCLKKFKENSRLTRHLKTKSANQRCMLCCQFCFRPFKNDILLSRHLNVHSNERLFNCQHCGKCFSRSSSLQIHMKRHNKRKKCLQCPTCKRKFDNNLRNLITHMKTHLKRNNSGRYSGNALSVDRSIYRVLIYRSKTGKSD